MLLVGGVRKKRGSSVGCPFYHSVRACASRGRAPSTSLPRSLPARASECTRATGLSICIALLSLECPQRQKKTSLCLMNAILMFNSVSLSEDDRRNVVATSANAERHGTRTRALRLSQTPTFVTSRMYAAAPTIMIEWEVNQRPRRRILVCDSCICSH